MGSWNKTCGLSNLHIHSGTPVYVFVLERNKTYDPCYSTGLFSPLLVPFESVYDDYGGGEDSSGVALDFVMYGLKKNLVEMEVGENEYHDIEVKKEGFTPEKFFEAVHEDRMQIQGRFSAEPTQVYFTMMRKDVVDTILATREIEDYVGDNKGTIAKWGDSKDYIRYKFADIAASIRPMLERLMKDLEGDEFGHFHIFDRLHNYRDDFLAARWINGDSHRYSRIVDVRMMAGEALKRGTVEAINKIEALLVEYLKGIYIDGFMSSARKSWIPGGHEGSQSTSGGALRLLAKATIDVLDKEKAEWLADMGEDESEYLED
jgi:hypothetical protein